MCIFRRRSLCVGVAIVELVALKDQQVEQQAAQITELSVVREAHQQTLSRYVAFRSSLRRSWMPPITCSHTDAH